MAKIEMIHRFFEFFSDLNEFSKNLRREKFDPKNKSFCSYLSIRTIVSHICSQIYRTSCRKWVTNFEKSQKITTNSKCQKKLKNDKIPKKPKNIITFYLFFLEFVWIFGYFQIP